MQRTKETLPYQQISDISLHLDSLVSLDKQYWAFKGRSRRNHCHAFISYPAMMVPEMQGELIDILKRQDPSINSIFDPFVGSGTTLGEALIRGFDFFGTDINPLAILSCEVKASPLFIDALKIKINDLKHSIQSDNSTEVDISFFGLNKWFIPRVQIGLCKLRRAIKQERQPWARRFFWLVLCDTVRKTCNSRSSTYKLHIKQEEIIENVSNPIEVFLKKLDKNLSFRVEQKQIHEKNGSLKSGRFISKVDLKLQDVNQPVASNVKQYDLMITSPPYGDNSTTVPYGQYSYLPLQWIDTEDLRAIVPKNLLKNSSSIDSAGLGGSRKDALKKAEYLLSLSPSFKETYNNISTKTKDGLKRLSSFIADLDSSLPNILSYLKGGGYMAWTLGNRNIGGVEVPLNKILRELLEAKECEFIYEINRDILGKRMPARNNASKTMTKETVLVMRKCQNE
ncbi:MAG: DNA modification methylase [Hyphomicrobiales bacterium]|nr:MAG: DNA modification methylase [Hyphomicrobiales bacterium]